MKFYRDEIDKRLDDLASLCVKNKHIIQDKIDKDIQRDISEALSTIDIMATFKKATSQGFCGIVLFETKYPEHSKLIVKKVKQSIEILHKEYKNRFNVYVDKDKVALTLKTKMIGNYKIYGIERLYNNHELVKKDSC
jgi:hypothetical protein